MQQQAWKQAGDPGAESFVLAVGPVPEQPADTVALQTDGTGALVRLGGFLPRGKATYAILGQIIVFNEFKYFKPHLFPKRKGDSGRSHILRETDVLSGKEG